MEESSDFEAGQRSVIARLTALAATAEASAPYLEVLLRGKDLIIRWSTFTSSLTYTSRVPVEELLKDDSPLLASALVRPAAVGER